MEKKKSWQKKKKWNAIVDAQKKMKTKKDKGNKTNCFSRYSPIDLTHGKLTANATVRTAIVAPLETQNK